MSRTLAAAGMILVLLWSMGAMAQVTPGREAQAKRLNRLGLEAIDLGDFTGAVAYFRQAFAQNPKPRYLFNVSRGLQVTGQWRLALVEYRRYRDLLTDPDKTKEVQEIIDELSTLLARLVIRTDPPGAAVEVDGDPDLCVGDVACLLDPGEHVVEVSMPGRVPIHRKIKLESGDIREETIPLPLTRESLSERITRGGIVWRSSLFPGVGQLYAGRRAAGISLAVAESAALATAIVGLSMQGWFLGQRNAEVAPDRWKSWNNRAGIAAWVGYGGLIAGGVVWVANLAHALAVPLPRTRDTARRTLVPAETGIPGFAFRF